MEILTERKQKTCHICAVLTADPGLQTTFPAHGELPPPKARARWQGTGRMLHSLLLFIITDQTTAPPH